MRWSGLRPPVAGCGACDAPGVDRAEPDFAAELAPHPGEEQIRCGWMFGGPAVGERHPVRAQHVQVAHQWLQAALVSRGADDRVGPNAAAVGQLDFRAAVQMLGLGRVAVQRSRFPVTHPPDSARQGSRQSLGRLPRTTHGELDLLVNLAGQAPGLILRPHQVRVLKDARCGPVPGHSRCVSECLDRAGEQQHHPMGDLHPRRLRRQRRACPALPDCRIPLGWRGRVCAENR
jgi:hypothetical protein